MKFVDSAKITVFSGKGGAGSHSMRREKYVPHGGPDGGDGGRGGNVYLQGEQRLTSLYDVRLHSQPKAGHGQPGLGKQCSGRAGKDLYIKVPQGTIIIDDETDDILFEILDETSRLLLQGGKGGLGNTHFKSSTNRIPRYAQPGEPGQQLVIRLELKFMADVGLVGLPNAGKSTYISTISQARPKVADYPFTTLIPNLGVVHLDGFCSFVVADIPGIIEGAHVGTGLGDQFLKHIQRTKVLAFLIDSTALGKSKPQETFKLLLSELGLYSQDLTTKKRIILLTKIDSIDPELNIQEIITQFREQGEEIYPISSVTGHGVKKTLYRLYDLVCEGRENLNPPQFDQEETQT